MDRMMGLDYTTFQGRRIPFFKTKQDAEQALLGGLIKDGQDIAIGRDSFANVEAGNAYVFAEGFKPVVARQVTRRAVGKQLAGREFSALAARQAATRQAGAAAARTAAARSSAQQVVARTAAERNALLARQEAAARTTAQRIAREEAAASRATAVTRVKTGRSATGFIAKGATITAVVGAAAIGGTAVVAQLKKQPETKVTDLPNGHKLLTYPDGSTAEVDQNGKVVKTSGPAGFKGAAEGASDLFKWGAVAVVVGVGAVALNRSSKAKATKAAGEMKAAGKAKAPKAPANLKPLAA